MKKVVNSLLVSALALSVIPTVAGAEDAATPVKLDPQMEKVVQRLSALGLIKGNETGDLQLDKTITRAEFATIMVRSVGKAEAAQNATFVPYFKDVTASDWFKGWVSIAVNEKLIVGYADKTFKPNNDVNYAQAVTMMVRALGYDLYAQQKGEWPNSHIAVASELGISQGVSIDPNKAATRGDIFKMLDNSLTVDIAKQSSWGTNNDFQILKGRNLLNEYLQVNVYDTKWTQTGNNKPEDLPVVTNVPVIGLGKLAANEVEFTGSNAFNKTKYVVTEGINANDFIGQHVQVWVKNRDNTVIWMEDSESETVVKDRLDSLYIKSKEVKDDVKEADLADALDDGDVSVELVNGKKYDLAKDVTLTYNYQRIGDSEKKVAEALKGMVKYLDEYSIKVVLDQKGKVSYLYIVDDKTVDRNWVENKFGSETVKSVSTKEIKTLVGKDLSLKDLEEGKDYLVFLDGKPAKLADLKENDTYSAYRPDGDKDKLLIFANRTMIEGKVEEVKLYTDAKKNRIRINGKDYKLNKASYKYDEKKDAVNEITNDEIKSLDGTNVKLFLDSAGTVRHIEALEANARKQTAVVSRSAQYDKINNEYVFTVVTEKGKKKKLELDPSDIRDAKGNKFGKNDVDKLQISADQPVVVKVEFDADDKVKEVRLVDSSDLKEVKNWRDNSNKDKNRVTIGSKTYDLASDASFFDLTRFKAADDEYTNVKMLKWKSIAEKKATVWALVDGSELDAAFVLDADSLASTSEFGFVTGATYNNGKDYLEMNYLDEDGKWVSKKFKYEGDKPAQFRDHFVRFTATNEDEIDEDDIYKLVSTKPDAPDMRLDDDAAKADLTVKAPIFVDDIKGKIIHFGKEEYRTDSDTIYLDIDGEEVGQINEDDYAFVFSGEDDEVLEFVLIVTDESEVDEKDWDMKKFLDGKPGPVDPDPEYIDFTNNTYEKYAGGLYLYGIAGELTGKAAEGTSVTIKVGSVTKTVDVKDAKFSAGIWSDAGAALETKATVTVYKGSEKIHEEDVKIVESK